MVSNIKLRILSRQFFDNYGVRVSGRIHGSTRTSSKERDMVENYHRFLTTTKLTLRLRTIVRTVGGVKGLR